MGKIENLLDELSKERKNIKTDSYSMSIGEIVSLYEEHDLKLDPAFQRLFRWDDFQKTKFIESILIGIPIPEIFVAQKADGTWDIVDGVQRISTLLQLTNNLEGYPPLILTEAKYLPSMEGLTWNELPMDVKRLLRRAKLGINIILTENSIKSQYELFQRLNTGGLHLEDQEIRNCLLIMINNDFYNKINELKEYPNFKQCLPLKEERFKEEYHMELIIRYLIAKLGVVDYSNYHISQDKLADFIDQEITNIITAPDFNLDAEVDTFKKTFDFLNENLGEDIFKKYNESKQKFEGAFSVASFEAIASGVAFNLEKVVKNDNFKKVIEDLYNEDEFKVYSARGTKALSRFRGLTAFSKEYFSR